MRILIRSNHLRVVSSILADLSAAFLIFALQARSPLILTWNIFFAIVFWYGAVKLLDIIDDLETK